MSRILTLTSTTLAVVLLASSLTVTGSVEQVQNQGRPLTREELDARQLKGMAVNIASVAKILKDQKIDLEPELFFTSRGRQELRSQLEKHPAMQSAKFHSGPLRGVVMAGSLTLAEKVPIAADTVVIARHIVFNGKAPVIRGPHDVHVFALYSISAANGTDTVVTIDTSGEGVNYVPVPAESQIKAGGGTISFNTSGADGADGADGAHASSPRPLVNAVAGANGNTGKKGVDGTPGKPGACAENNVGGNGGSGSDGVTGENGGPGSKGKDGTDAHNLSITIPNINSPHLQLVAKGGDGTAGGPGGRAGNGGRGGNGGTGGAGIGCQCVANGVGEAGAGGIAGSGGAGGAGGRGGDGGNGGNGGHFAIFFPPRLYDMSRLRTFGGAGRGGRGGQSGSGGVGGQSGTPGRGGPGGTFADCAGRTGTFGANGNPGDPGRPGAPGNPGNPGAPGSLSVHPF